MEKNRNKSLYLVIALVAGIVALSLGFAFTATQLKVSSSAEVSPVDDFHVYFSSSSSTLATDDISGTPSAQNVGIVASDAEIDNSTNAKKPTITNLHAKFTQPGQYVTYSFYAWNDNDYPAYLKSLTFASTTPTCTAKNSADQDSVDAACAGISLSISVGSSITNQKTSLTTIESHVLNAKGSTNTEPIVVKIDYAESAKKASGDFDVTFGDITLEYDTN